jgi:hypothetical protein
LCHAPATLSANAGLGPDSTPEHSQALVCQDHEEASPYHCRRISVRRNALNRHDIMSSIHRLQEMLDRSFANLATVLNPFLDRFPEMIPDQDA